ncbi:RNA polymerase sigma factor [Patulibacter sp. NPDC049589]|uniref:RNA polymerase sigma factor n=1 Tax=Patulibacter sp. NPDC049589 TaxID=3154731 RepID=UPI0034441DEF
MTAPGATPDPDAIARRALDVGRRTALGVLAGDAATADDVAQEVAILAVRHAHRLRDPAALDGWLHRTAVRAALRTVRRGRRRHDVEEAHVAVHGRVATEPAGPLEDLGRLLSSLPERQRAELTLRYAHDLDDDAIAAALGCRAGTVRALLSRGRAALRERLAPPGPPADRLTPGPRTTPGDHDA